ncbi:MAG: hypothetical protein RIT27_21 [Pseudomonadota bacterium]|jgi:adenylate cyclase
MECLLRGILQNIQKKQIMQPFQHVFKLPLAGQLFLLSQLVFLLIYGARSALEPLELTAYDGILTHRSAQITPNHRVTLIWLTDADQRRYGYPISDAHLIELLKILIDNAPRVIGFDMYRDLPVPLNQTPAFEELSRLFQQQTNIIGITKFPDAQGHFVSPPPALQNTNRVTFNDLLYDDGYIIRRGLFFMDDGKGKWFEYFGLKLVSEYLKKSKIYIKNSPSGSLQWSNGVLFPAPLKNNVGGYLKNDAGGYQFLLTYPSAPAPFQAVSFSDVLDHRFDVNLIRDNIIVIGTCAEATPDFLTTPFSRWLEGDQRICGAAVHAYAVNQLLQWAEGTAPLQPESLPEWLEILWIWIACSLASISYRGLRNFGRFVVVNVAGLVMIGAVFYQGFMVFNVWIIVIAPLMGWQISLLLIGAYDAYRARNERAALMSLFSRHVSKDIAQLLWESRDKYVQNGRLLPQRLTATVLFSDLQNFTTLAESLEPQVLMEWLNHYMDKMVQAVENHQGQVNKFMGDAVMGIFGAPIPSDTDTEIARDAVNAVEASLAMREAIVQLQHEWELQGFPPLRMRVGIFTGGVVAGTLGSSGRQEYTVLGDTVNTASRLESFDKSLDENNPCRILIGDATLYYVKDQFITEPVGQVFLKGKHHPITLHLVQSRRHEINR